MKILLVVPTVDTCYEYVLPMGLMNLYLIAEECGCQVKLMNLSTTPYKKGLEQLLEEEYDLVGMSANFTNAVTFGLDYAKLIKAKYPNTIVIAGGNHSTLQPEDLLYNKFDYIIYGEGELTFKEFVLKLKAGQSPDGIDGIYRLENNEIVKNPPRAIIENLDELPFNDYTKFELEPYFKWAGIKYLNMETVRGCKYNCAFCATVKMWGNKIRIKSPRRIVDEFKVAKRLGCDYVFICDDDTAIDEKNLRDFCQLLLDEDAVVPWGSTFGSKSIKDESTYALMAKAGCVKANICVESANARLLRAYRKPYGVEDNRRTCYNFLKHGILVHNHAIIGYHDETLREMLNTYFYLMSTSPIWHISILEPRPGTDYWQSWGKKGDVSQYKFFGKANVFLTKRRLTTYFLYRFFALGYFLNPKRIWYALTEKSIANRYNHRIQYYVAYRTILANIGGFFKSYREKFSALVKGKTVSRKFGNETKQHDS